MAELKDKDEQYNVFLKYKENSEDTKMFVTVRIILVTFFFVALTAFTMFFGMFISLLVVMLSLNCYVLCEHIKTENSEDTRFAYMYTYKYPEKQVPEGGEAVYGVTLEKEMLGYNLDVTLLGIDRDNPYFDIVKEGDESFCGENTVQISSSMAQKYHLHAGDDLVLKDEENDRNYAFTIEGIVPYSTSFFAFMDIDSMRELMGEDEGIRISERGSQKVVPEWQSADCDSKCPVGNSAV